MTDYVLRPQFDEYDRLAGMIVEGWKVAKEEGDVPQNAFVEITEGTDGRFIVPGVPRPVKTLVGALGCWLTGQAKPDVPETPCKFTCEFRGEKYSIAWDGNSIQFIPKAAQ